MSSDEARSAGPSNPRTWIFVGFLGLLVVAALGAIAAYRLAPKHLETVAAGVLYRSAQLPPDQLAAVVERLNIKTVVNLRSLLEREKGDWYRREKETLSAKRVRLVDLPMHTGYPPDEVALAGWLDLLADESNHPILVHCEYGVVRTGLMVSLFRIEHLGHSREAVLSSPSFLGRKLEEPIHSRLNEFLSGYSPRDSNAS